MVLYTLQSKFSWITKPTLTYEELTVLTPHGTAFKAGKPAWLPIRAMPKDIEEFTKERAEKGNYFNFSFASGDIVWNVFGATVDFINGHNNCELTLSYYHATIQVK